MTAVRAMLFAQSVDLILSASLVGTSPDVHFLRLANQLVAELRMRHGDNGLRLLPGGQALEVNHTVFRHKIVDVRAGIGDDGAVRERRQNTGLQVALLVCEGRGAADEALAALGKVRAEHEIELAARAADRLGSGDSAFTWPNRSRFTALLMEMKLSSSEITRTSLV